MCWKFLRIVLPLTAAFACSESDIDIAKRNILPLKTGNYWIYRTVTTLPDGQVQYFPYLDSVWIEKDTTINGTDYWMQTGTMSGTVYLRDSADCVLMRQLTFEQIVFSTNNKDTLERYPPIYKKITDVNQSVRVPVGTTLANNCRTIIRKEPGGSGHDTEYPSYDSRFYTAEQRLYSPSIGLVKYVYYFLGSTIEYELVRYNVN